MRKIFLLCIFCILCACLPQEKYTLHLVHTNDLHSHLLPFNDYGDCHIDSQDCLGGFARIVTLMKQEKKKHPNTLILDAGDRFTGTPFYTLTKSRYLIRTMSRMPYDALTFGNHEFDEDNNETEKFIKALNVPVVCANLKFLPESGMSSNISPSLVLKKGGRKIGIIGAVTPELSPLGMNKAVLSAQDDIATAIKEEVQKLQAQGVNIIILLSHIGLDEDIKLAQAVPELDIIVSGHSHSLLTNDEENPHRDAPYPVIISHKDSPTLLVSVGMGGQFVGLLDVVFDKNGHIIDFNGDAKAITADIENDPITEEIIKDAQQNIEQIVAQKLAVNTRPLDFTPNSDYCAEQCAVGEFVADLLLHAYPEADVALLNSGAIRRALPAGEITFGHLAQVYPYDSAVVLFDLSGAQLRQYFENGIAHYLLHDRTNEMLQTAGASYDFLKNEKKIQQVMVKGKPLDDEKIYRIVTSQFIANGGDAYPVQHRARQMNISVREALQQQLLKLQKIDFAPNGNISAH